MRKQIVASKNARQYQGNMAAMHGTIYVKTMKIKYATISKTGRRSNNEDCFNVLEMPEHNRFMGIVCDGIGGHSFGEVASEAVCDAISKYWQDNTDTPDSDQKVVNLSSG